MSYELKYPHLFSPLKVGNLTFRNRIMSAPASLMHIGRDGHYTEGDVAFFEEKARGGVAVVTHGVMEIDEAHGTYKPYAVQLNDNPDIMPTLVFLARAITRHGAYASGQLLHAGIRSVGIMNIGAESHSGSLEVYGPSSMFIEPGEINTMGAEVKAMSETMILDIIDRFGRGAARLKEAGFNIVQVHAAHGWLFSQFLEPKLNKRQDRWGGSLENRARILIMTVERIRQVVGPGFPIEVRLNGQGGWYGEGSYTTEECVEVCKMLDGKCDIINVSSGLFETWSDLNHMFPSVFKPHGLNIQYAAAIKKEMKHTLVSVTGAMHQPAMMEEAIASGKVDLIHIGRGLLADTELPRKARLGLDEEITPCIRCNTCFSEDVRTRCHMCVVNPAIMAELGARSQKSLPTTPKKVLIAGGGPAGMKAAITLADRGHKVILAEKSGSLGGALRIAEFCDFKYDIWRLVKHLRHMVAKKDIEVHLNTEVTPEYVDKISPDVLFVALGAKPIVPPIPGIKGKNVMLAEAVFGHEDEVGKNVVVIGGGLVGREAAVYLSHKGHKCTVIEMRGEDAEKEFEKETGGYHWNALSEELNKCGVVVDLNTKCLSINEKGAACVNKHGEEVFYPADTVLCAVGYENRDPMINALRSTAPLVEVIGDAHRPAKVQQAMWTSYFQSLNI